MSTKRIKEECNEPSWNNLDRFTKPNGRIETSKDGQLVFIPRNLPPKITHDRETIMLLATAERKMGELKGIVSGRENPHILTRACLKREAVMSSKIEGTLATLKDLNRHEAIGSIGKRDTENLRLREVINYVDALEESLGILQKSRQCVNLDVLRKAHKRLMTGVDGYDKNPGEIRNQQNWIIKTQGTRREIVYTPPPPERIPVLLEDLEAFLQDDHESLSVLIQCAVMHYQFEAIHPFLDGNGRIGRLMIPLVLYKKEVLPEPLLCMSAYFDRHREQYYSGLLDTSRKSQWGNWIKFFLRGFIEQTSEAIDSMQKSLALMKRYRGILHGKNTSRNVVLLMEHLFSNPYITIPLAGRLLNNTYPSAKNAVMALVEAGILKQTGMRYKSKVFVAEEIEKTINA